LRLLTALLISAGLLAGCSTIINGKTQPVAVNSVPEGASITVTERGGEVVHTGQTPVKLELKRGYGYFKPQTYTIRFEKPGYAAKEILLAGQVNGWYFGNILFGGVVLGMLIVDPNTGGMYTLAPEKLEAALEAMGEKFSASENSLTVVLVEDVPAAIMKHARRID
jgi:hypothetical protein